MPSLRPAFIACLLLFLTCPRAAAQPPTAIDRVVARVGNEPILWSEVMARSRVQVARFRADKRDPLKSLQAERQYLQRTLQDLIDDRLFAQAAKELGIEVTDAEVDHALESVAKDNHLTLPQLFATAFAEGLSASIYRQDLRSQLLRWKVVQQDERDGGTLTSSNYDQRMRKWIDRRRRKVCVEHIVRFS